MADMHQAAPSNAADNMTINKPEVELADNASQVNDLKGMDVAEQGNAVGYKEYLEAMDIEVTEKEV